METTVRLATVRFRDNMSEVRVGARSFEPRRGDMVMVATEHGLEPATVVSRAIPLDLPEETCLACDALPKIERPATEEEIVRHRENLALEKTAYQFSVERVQEFNLPMDLVSTECFFDGSKILFYFTSEGRVDFRELVKTLVQRFHTRIEMRQIGVRNETKRLGGVSHCGRQLCCASFLSEFEPISIRMAKEQDLPLNPAKISGVCGRLLCCLAYEYKTYAEIKKGLPKLGKRVKTREGEGKVIRHNSLRNTFIVSLAEGREVELTPADLLTEDGK